MQRKVFIPELKMLDDGAGVIEGYASTFANWDSVGERPARGAFAPHLDAFLKDGFIAIGHDWTALPAATPIEAREDEHGLFVKAQFHSTQAAQDARTVVTERLARGKSVKLSIGYEVLADEYVPEGRVLKEIKLYEWSLVTVPANQQAAVTFAKGLPLADHTTAVLDAAADLKERLKNLSELRAKEGRVLSAANRSRIASLKESLAAVLADLDALLAATDPTQTDAKAALAAYAEFLRLDATLGAYR